MLGKSIRLGMALAFLITGSHLFAQTPSLSETSPYHAVDYNRLSLRLGDWVAENEGTLNQKAIGLRLASDFDIYAFDQELYAENASLEERTQRVINKLQYEAGTKQPGLIAWMRMIPGIDLSRMENYWVDNLIFLEATSDAIATLSLNSAIEFIDFNAELSWDEPVEMIREEGDNTRVATPGGHEPGHDAIAAPAMWSMGYTGYGRLAMSIDTGVDPGHPALGWKWQGNFKPASQSWFDGGGNYSSAQDCGGSFHGSHTTGTMVGLDPSTNDTIGVAFNARWIASPGICSGNSTSARVAAFQWAMNPDSDINTTSDMPDAICNSWFDPNTSNECNGLYRQTFDAVEAVGIAVVFSAGNSGPSTSTITLPKNINNDTTSVFCVGSTEKFAPYNISNFSSRGPSTCGGTGSLNIKPEVSAPGGTVRSAVSNGGYASYSGTSMAAPHVCGAILLLKEAFPFLTGRQLKMALYMSATDLGAPGEDNTYGMGIINVPAAYNFLLNQGHTPEVYDTDAAPIAVVSPMDQNCDNNITAEITIQNDGLTPLTSLTIEYRFFPSPLSTFNWTGNLAPGSNATVSLPATNLPDGSYTLEVFTSNPNNTADDRPFNDCIFADFSIQGAADVTGDTLLPCPGVANLTTTNVPPGGNVNWFDASVGGNQVGTGANYAPSVATTSTFYAEIEYSESAGAPDNNIGGGGYFATDNRWIFFDAFQPFTLNSVLVYANSPGNRTIELRDNNGTVLDQATVNLTTGQQRVTLDFAVPVGSDFELALNGTADLYRNNAGVNYPYTLPNVLSVTRSNANTALAFYYFFYDWEVSFASNCGRTPITVQVTGNGSVAAIGQSATQVDLSISGTVNFTDNSSPAATSWFWDFGDGNSSNQQNPSHTYTQIGTYTVMLVTDPGSSCSDTSFVTVEVVNTVNLEDGLETSLNVYPNPTFGWVNLQLIQAQAEPVDIALFNAQGAKVMDMSLEGQQEIQLPLDLSELAAGTYFLKVNSLSGQKVRRIMKR